MPMPNSFSVSFNILQKDGQSRAATAAVLKHAGTTTRVTAPRVQQLLDDHRPWKMLNNMALIIIDQTYAGLLEIVGRPPEHGRHVEVRVPVDPGDPDSPLLCVNAGATHCCISLVGGGGAAPEYYGRKYVPCHHRLARASVSVSPGTVHLARVDGGDRTDYWTCAEEVRPDVAEKGLLGVLGTIRSRLDAAIRVEARLIEMASGGGGGGGCCGRSPNVGEDFEVLAALAKMRREVDVDAIVRRPRCQNRLRVSQETGCRSPADKMNVDEVYDAEELAERLSALHVCQKRRRRVEEIGCRPVAEMVVDTVEEAEVLAKRLRALHV